MMRCQAIIRRTAGGIFCSALLYVSSACSYQQVEMKKVFSSNDCAIAKSSLKFIHSQTDLNKVLSVMPRRFSQVPLFLPEVNYEKQRLVLFALGQKSTGGYVIESYQDMATIKGSELQLPLRVHQPSTNQHHIQILTSPCNIYLLPNGDYSSVVLKDSNQH